MVLLLVAVLLLGCGPQEQPVPELQARPSPRHVIVVSMDTVRADAIGAWGRADRHTPNLDEIARSGVRFTSAMAPAPTTLASHTSLLSGLYPHHHGVPRNEHRVPDALRMLPEVFAEAGFATGAFLGGMPLAEHTNFLQGFGHVDASFDRGREAGFEQVERRGAQVTEAALAWAARNRDERLFLFAHYFDAHQPYDPEQRFARLTGARRAAADMAQIYAIRDELDRGNPRALILSEWLERLYQAQVAEVDMHVAHLTRGLKELGLDDYLLILTSDHGEAFAAHDEIWDHGWRVYDETVHVPLVFAGAGLAAREVSTPVSLTDVAPTVLAQFGLPVGTVDGVDLGPLLRGEPMERGPVFSEATKPPDPAESGWMNAMLWKAVRLGDEKLHWDPESDAHELYDLADAPGERVDLTRLQPRAVVALKQLLEEWASQADPLPSDRVDDAEAIEKLKALGYLQ